MTFKVLNVKKPCTVCRRRKVKCDKGRPCANCLRHRVPCVYEEPRDDSVARQHLLQERLDRLESIVEQLAAKSLSTPASTHDSSPSAATPLSLDGSDASPLDTGSQVFTSSNSYHICSSSWMNLPQLGLTEHHLLSALTRRSSEESSTSSAWSISTSQTRPKHLDHFHLAPCKEDLLIRLFFDHVEPFIRICHQAYLWKTVCEFRQGTCVDRLEVQALIFSVQYIAASLLPNHLLQEKLGVSRMELVDHLQRATEFALDQANLMQTRNTLLFSALLYYMTAQFYTGNSETGLVLLGLASSIAKRMGLHRDPAHYGYTTWHIEVRRRLWGHLVTLETHFCNSDEHTLMSISDVQPSLNLDEIDWELPGYASKQMEQQNREGYSEATAALLRREICRASYLVSKARKTATVCADLTEILDETMQSVRQRFLRYFTNSNPLQFVMSKWYKSMAKSLAISILYVHTLSAPKLYCHSFQELQEQSVHLCTSSARKLTMNRLYEDCLVCLEEFSQGEEMATAHHWQWIFRWPVLLHVIAGLLSCLVHLPHHDDTDRAWQQVDAAFQRYNNDNISMANVPAWHSIEMLCDKAMLAHPNQNHEGRAYTVHLGASDPIPHPEKQVQMASFGEVCEIGDNARMGEHNATGIAVNKSINLGASGACFDPMWFDANIAEHFWSIDF